MGKEKDADLLAYQIKDVLEMHFSEDDAKVRSVTSRIMGLVENSKPADEVRHLFGFGLSDAAVLIRDGAFETLNQVLVLDRRKESVDIFVKRSC